MGGCSGSRLGGGPNATDRTDGRGTVPRRGGRWSQARHKPLIPEVLGERGADERRQCGTRTGRSPGSSNPAARHNRRDPPADGHAQRFPFPPRRAHAEGDRHNSVGQWRAVSGTYPSFDSQLRGQPQTPECGLWKGELGSRIWSAKSPVTPHPEFPIPHSVHWRSLFISPSRRRARTRDVCERTIVNHTKGSCSAAQSKRPSRDLSWRGRVRRGRPTGPADAGRVWQSAPPRFGRTPSREEGKAPPPRLRPKTTGRPPRVP